MAVHLILTLADKDRTSHRTKDFPGVEMRFGSLSREPFLVDTSPDHQTLLILGDNSADEQYWFPTDYVRDGSEIPSVPVLKFEVRSS